MGICPIQFNSAFIKCQLGYSILTMPKVSTDPHLQSQNTRLLQLQMPVAKGEPHDSCNFYPKWLQIRHTHNPPSGLIICYSGLQNARRHITDIYECFIKGGNLETSRWKRCSWQSLKEEAQSFWSSFLSPSTFLSFWDMGMTCDPFNLWPLFIDCRRGSGLWKWFFWQTTPILMLSRSPQAPVILLTY